MLEIKFSFHSQIKRKSIFIQNKNQIFSAQKVKWHTECINSHIFYMLIFTFVVALTKHKKKREKTNYTKWYFPMSRQVTFNWIKWVMMICDICLYLFHSFSAFLLCGLFFCRKQEDKISWKRKSIGKENQIIISIWKRHEKKDFLSKKIIYFVNEIMFLENFALNAFCLNGFISDEWHMCVNTENTNIMKLWFQQNASEMNNAKCWTIQIFLEIRLLFILSNKIWWELMHMCVY